MKRLGCQHLKRVVDVKSGPTVPGSRSTGNLSVAGREKLHSKGFNLQVLEPWPCGDHQYWGFTLFDFCSGDKRIHAVAYRMRRKFLTVAILYSCAMFSISQMHLL